MTAATEVAGSGVAELVSTLAARLAHALVAFNDPVAMVSVERRFLEEVEAVLGHVRAESIWS